MAKDWGGNRAFADEGGGLVFKSAWTAPRLKERPAVRPLPRMPVAVGSGQRRQGLHQGFAQGRQQAGEGNRPAVLWPGDTVHSDEELTGGGKRGSYKVDFEVFVSVKILDRNSQVCFHNPMIKARDRKVTCARRRARSVS